MNTYTFREIAQLLEHELNTTVSLAQLRAPVASPRTHGRPSIVTGMPAALPTSSRTAPRLFDAADIDAWIQHHPWKLQDQALTQFTTALRKHPKKTAPLVIDAYEAGLSWRQISTAWRSVDPSAPTAQALQARYRDYFAPDSC